MADDIISVDVSSWEMASKRIREAMAALEPTLRAQITIGVEEAARQIAVDTLKDFTPVATGALQESTMGVVTIEGDRIGLLLEQPATNRTGVYYAPFVIMGHHTRSGSFVPPNPYPQEAWDAMKGAIDNVLREVGRKALRDTVHMMGAV